MQGSGFRVQGLWCRVQTLEFRVQDSRFRVYGRELRGVGIGSAVAREVDNFQEFDDFYRMKEPGSDSARDASRGRSSTVGLIRLRV